MSGLVFGAPLVLLGLLTLPLLWWLLRLTPPAPRVVVFPPTRILRTLKQNEETSSKSPLWLTLLRLAMAALVILALAAPMLAPSGRVAGGEGPLALLVDNGWSAAPGWERRMETARQIIDAQRRAGDPVYIVPTSDPSAARGPIPATEAQELADTLVPQPFAPARMAALDALADKINGAPVRVAWLADGIAHSGDGAFAARLTELDSTGAPDIYAPQPADLPIALAPPDNGSARMTIALRRTSSAASDQAMIRAFDSRGNQIAETMAGFTGDALTTEAVFDLPIELRNAFRRLEIDGARHAGAVQLLDTRFERRTVGIVSGGSRDIDQPLLSPTHYITNALSPFANVRTPADRNAAVNVQALIERGVSAIVLTDVGTLPDETVGVLEEWVDGGGLLIRFAGDRLAASTDDRLLPTELRRGGRTLGGTLSWSEPRNLAPFADTSPFAGIDLEDTTTVSRQVLAVPTADLVDLTWAELDDGTPLVTAARQGAGWVVLFHVAADRRWSNLALTGTFVDMMRRLVELSGSAPEVASATADDGTAGQTPAPAEDARLLSPNRLLDGFGALAGPSALAQPIAASEIDSTVASIDNPPGLYGPEGDSRALNLIRADTALAALDRAETGSWQAYPETNPVDLAPWLLSAAAILMLLDALAVLWIAGRLFPVRTATAATVLAAALLAGPPPAQAQELDLSEAEAAFAMAAANETRLAFVETGNDEIDRVSRAGLRGLSFALATRTALEPGEPMAVDIERDELSFFPLLYWAVDPDAETPDPATLSRIDAYMKGGGTILFDTRDALGSSFGLPGAQASPATLALRRILAGLDVPALEPVPDDHVLTKTFYLLTNFPGRQDAGALWVEAQTRGDEVSDRPARAGDGVSTILITSNDLAGAWAIDDIGRPLLPMGIGGLSQREMAFRSGINIVMYTMTGNYKADQVHIPALLERLGQ